MVFRVINMSKCAYLLSVHCFESMTLTFESRSSITRWHYDSSNTANKISHMDFLTLNDPYDRYLEFNYHKSEFSRQISKRKNQSRHPKQ